MNQVSSYSTNYGGVAYFELNVQGNPDQTNNPTGESSGGGSGGGGGSGSRTNPPVNVSNVFTQCSANYLCSSWSPCQSLEVSYKNGTVNSTYYQIFKSDCEASGLNAFNCGYQVRSCATSVACNSTIPPVQSQYCPLSGNNGVTSNLPNLSGISASFFDHIWAFFKNLGSLISKMFNKTVMIYIYILIAIILLVLFIISIVKLISFYKARSEENLKWYKM